MAAYYLALRHAHIGFVIASITLFTVRGLLMFAGSRWYQAPAVRYLSYTIDTLLLTAALMLTTIIHQYPGTTGWLTMKVVLLVIYVMLGTVALKRGRTPTIRVGAFVAALLTVGFMVTVARAHHPLGIFASWLATASPA